jgi:hypothetical protein
VLLSPQGSGSGGGATPAGSTADIQFNSGGLLAADTGKFTYTAATGTLSTTTVSATRINVAPSVSTVVSLNGGGGGVGIGNLTPNAPLVVQKDSTDYTRLRLRNTNAAGGTGYYFGTDADNDYAAFIIANNTSNTAYSGANSLNFVNAKGAMSFSTATNGVFERMRIDTNGNMQLATTATYAGANSRLTIAYFGGGTMHGIALKPTTDNTNPIDFLNASGSYVGSITQNTTTTTYNTTSDRRVKDNITDTREGRKS